MKKAVLLMLIALAAFSSQAQLNFNFTAGKFLIKGKVVDLKTKAGLPLANIKITNTGKGISCENDGSFSLYVSKSDTLRFSYEGYLAKVLYVYNIDSASFYTLQIELLHDFIKLKDVTIYPFRDPDDLKDKFLEARNVNKITIAGVPEPKYGNKVPKAKFNNPISLLYEKTKRRRAANPDFKP